MNGYVLDLTAIPRQNLNIILFLEHGQVSKGGLIADIYISISTETFDIENIKYEKTLATVRFRYIL